MSPLKVRHSETSGIIFLDHDKLFTLKLTPREATGVYEALGEALEKAREAKHGHNNKN